MTIQRGQTTVVEGASSYTSNSDGSGTSTRTFTGTGDDITLLANQLVLQGYTTQIEQGTPWKLTATLSYNLIVGGNPQTEPENIWSITSHAGEQNILESDIPLVTGLTTEIKDNILFNLKNPKQKIPLYSPSTPNDIRTKATTLFTIMQTGADAKRYIAKSVSRTITVPKSYISTWNLANEGSVLSKNALISTTNMPLWVQVLLPESGETVSNGIALYKGYLEEGANRQGVADDQVQISQTWVFNTWVAAYYTVVA